MSRPLLCRLGIHTSTFLDSALVVSAYRCNRCDGWVDPDEGERVERARAFLSADTDAETPKYRRRLRPFSDGESQ